jgi:hypothetical protein
MNHAVIIARKVGGALRDLRVAKGLTVGAVQSKAGVWNLANIEVGKATIGELDSVARVFGTTLQALVERVKTPSPSGAPSVPPSGQGLKDVADIVLMLPIKGSKVDATVDTLVLEAMVRAESNQSAAARLLGMDRKIFVRRFQRAKKRIGRL